MTIDQLCCVELYYLVLGIMISAFDDVAAEYGSGRGAT